MPSTGIGCTAPDETTVITRPQRDARIAGSSASVSAITDRTISSKLRVHSAARRPVAPP